MERTTWKARNCIDPFLILPLFMIATLPAFIVYMHAGSSPYSNLIFFVPMVLLGEIGIFFGRRNEKKEKSKACEVVMARAYVQVLWGEALH